MKPQLIIFDWAGTTVDYGCFAPVNAFALAFQKFGVNPTVEEIRAPMGMLKRDHIRTMLAMPAIQRQWQENQGAADEAAVEKIYGVFEDSLMESLADYAAPKPGVVETVEALRAQGIAIGSTTGYTDQMMAVVTQGAARQGYAPRRLVQPGQRPGPGPAIPLHDLCQHGPVPNPLRSRCGEGGGHGRGHSRGKKMPASSPWGCWRAAASWASPRRSTRPSRPRTGSVSWPGPRRLSWPPGPTAFC